MFRENKNLKDSPASSLGITIKDTSLSISYTKTDKLITALYMVTDIIDKDEPLRFKLRTLGTNIISDINNIPANACAKIAEIMSFLGIASAMNIVSEMNCNILRKEFTELDQAIKKSADITKTIDKHINLSDFFREDLPAPGLQRESFIKGKNQSIGHRHFTSIGVQKGSTLLKALSDKELLSSLSDKNNGNTSASNFDLLKKQRREQIINIIKNLGGNATIKDIKDKIQTTPEQASLLVSYGEKTLQRELISMVKDGVLNKTGEKRWSRYFLK